MASPLTTFARTLAATIRQEKKTKQPDQQPKRKRTSFLDLPPELRNRIYESSGCLAVHQCKFCNRTWTGDRLKGAFPPHCHSHCNFCRRPTPKMTILRPKTYRDMYQRACCATSESHDAAIPYIEVDRSWRQRERLSESDPPPPSPPGHRRRLTKTQPKKDKQIAGVAQPALTRVCRQVREDTLGLWYGNQHFVFFIGSVDPHVDLIGALRWLRMIGPVNASRLRGVTFMCLERWELLDPDVERKFREHVEMMGVTTTSVAVKVLSKDELNGKTLGGKKKTLKSLVESCGAGGRKGVAFTLFCSP